MFNLKKMLTAIGIVLTFCFTLNAFALQHTHKDKTSYLFIQSAKLGMLKPGKGPGTFVLTLYTVDPYITYFTDRPERQTGILETNKFFSMWDVKNKNSFSQNAPNVDVEGVKLSGFYDDKSDANVVFKLSNPVYDIHKERVMYIATPLSGDQIQLKHKVTLHNPRLFFDNLSGICLSCSR